MYILVRNRDFQVVDKSFNCMEINEKQRKLNIYYPLDNFTVMTDREYCEKLYEKFVKKTKKI